MTFLSATSDVFSAERLTTAAVPRPAVVQAPAFAQFAATLIFVAALTVPGAVAQAKWSKIGLVATFMQHRCVAAFST